MEELDFKETTEKSQEDPRQNEIRFIGSMRRPHKGMKLWEFNMKTGDLQSIDPEKSIALGEYGQIEKTAKMQADPNCSYLWAINEKNAAKKLFKMGYIESIHKNEDN